MEKSEVKSPEKNLTLAGIMVRDLTAVLLSTGSGTLNCMHCHGKQHSNCMEKGSSPLLQGGNEHYFKGSKNTCKCF